MVRSLPLRYLFYVPELTNDRHFNGEESFDPNPGFESPSKL